MLDDVSMNLIETMDDVAEFSRWLSTRDEDKPLAFDTETTGLKLAKDHVRLAQIGDEFTGWAMDWNRWSGVFEDTVNKWPGQWVGHNSPFDVGFTGKAGVKMPKGRVQDTRVMAHINEPTMSTALKKQAGRWVDPRAGGAQKELDEALGKNGGWTWATIPITFTPYWSYAALDCALTAQLYHCLWPRIQHATKSYEIENAAQYITKGMEEYGAHVDVDYAKQHQAKFLTYCDEVEQWCKDRYNVKPGSNAEIVRVLTDAGWQFSKATASGAVALDKEVLEGIDHPLARAVLSRRQLQKLASTYLRHYIEEVDGDDLIHPSINTLGARTSRMSMSEPNLQNLPRASERNKGAQVIRNCISARPGHTMIFCDFSQIEMRILAWLANDANMIRAFRSEGDFFVNLAQQVYRDESIDKKHHLRQRIKNVGYAKIYGAGIEKLALTAGISQSETRETLAGFDSQFIGVKRYQDETSRLALERRAETGTAYAECPLTGRRHPSDKGKEYSLVNYVIQGAAAALFKMKLIELDMAGIGQWMVAPVHDEVILDVPNEHVPGVVDILMKVMNDYVILGDVPVEAEVSFGQRWGEKHGWHLKRWRDSVPR